MALVHLLLVAVWGGVLLVEGVLEIVGSGSLDGMRRVAWAHYWIDVCVEVPVVLGVLMSGMMLALAVPAFTGLHVVKLGAGLLAIAINLSCVGFVLRRQAAAGDDAELQRLHRRVRLAGIGFPPGILAAYLGLAYFH